MKKTIQNTVLGGFASLILGSSLACADDTKKPQTEAPKGGVLSREAKDEVLEQVEAEMKRQIDHNLDCGLIKMSDGQASQDPGRCRHRKNGCGR